MAEEEDEVALDDDAVDAAVDAVDDGPALEDVAPPVPWPPVPDDALVEDAPTVVQP